MSCFGWDFYDVVSQSLDIATEITDMMYFFLERREIPPRDMVCGQGEVKSLYSPVSLPSPSFPFEEGFLGGQARYSQVK